jgi:hypothetical protein
MGSSELRREQIGTPKADVEFKSFKKLGRGAVTSSFLYYYARLIETLASIEREHRKGAGTARSRILPNQTRRGDEAVPTPRDSGVPVAVAILGGGDNLIGDRDVLRDLKIEHPDGGEISAVFKGVLKTRFGWDRSGGQYFVGDPGPF